MSIKNLLIKNNTYDGVRAVISASQSGVQNFYYTEARGDRYYYSITGSTASPTLETVTFNAYLSFTMSGAVTYALQLIPMSTGDTCFLEMSCSAVNASGSKGYLSKVFGGFRHTGTALSIIGSSIDYQTKTDFTSALGVSFSASGTQSVRMVLTGQTSEVVDWDIYVNYTKGYHTLTTGGGGGGGGADPWYPQPPLS
jgi:hypothetical protein